MDAADVEAITKIVKMVGAEFKGASDEDIKFWIELQAPVISRKKFGADYNLALALLTCHAMKMAGSGDDSLGTIANTGRLASVSEGGVSIGITMCSPARAVRSRLVLFLRTMPRPAPST